MLQGDKPENICVWNKTNAGQGTFYRSKHEFVVVFKNGTAPHINNFELGQKGRYRTNVWTYEGMTVPRKGRLQALHDHPTVKPTKLVADALLDCSHRGHLVLDTFAGSGTTILAAEHTGRRARAVEIEPHYVDTSVRRWMAMTKQTAVLERTGRSFEITGGERNGAPS